jgi:hypothetical protein
MKNQSEKQKLACHRNWFKFKLAGFYFPFQKDSLTNEENEKWNKIQELRRELLESFRENSVKKGLKVPNKCWCGKTAKYASFDGLVCRKHSNIDENYD